MIESKSKTITVKVFPKSGRSEVEGYRNGVLIVRLKGAPEKGKANEELIKVLAKYYGVLGSQIKIKRGSKGQNKKIEISD